MAAHARPPAESEPERELLGTERAVFRLWRSDDLPRALLLWGDPRVTASIDARGRLGEAQVRERLLGEIAVQEEHGVQY